MFSFFVATLLFPPLTHAASPALDAQAVITFLTENTPARDKSLFPGMVAADAKLAIEARDKFPWAKQIPNQIFLNDVAPYAVLDEKREPWRANLMKVATPIVKDCKTATEAAQALNRDLFKKLGVDYNTTRERPNQSPSESIASGKATCTGLSILLVDACRSVGVPARIAGVEQWTNKPGNHTWVEIWDGGWHFTGAAEYDAAGLDHSWFADDIAHGKKVQPIFASSWQRTGLSFPLVWNLADNSVPAIDVTGSYKQPAGDFPHTALHVTLVEKSGGARIAAPVEWLATDGTVISTGTTGSESADLNDMAELSGTIPPQGTTLRASHFGEWRVWPVALSGTDDAVLRLNWDEGSKPTAAAGSLHAWIAGNEQGPAPRVALSGSEATLLLNTLWQARKQQVAADEKPEFDGKQIVFGDKKMPWLERTFGDAPEGHRSLWISMHGGGNAPQSLNDEQWQNQIRLYEPAEGIVVAPRAPTNDWNLWHEDHIDPMFDRLIAGMVATRGVDPNRVYLMGYSAGGDGVYQLAPRLADHFAAASMMAGHPNDARPEGLRNLPFFIFVGGADDGYGRNKIAAEWGAKLDALAAADPGAYIHKTTIYPGLPHWMNRRDAEVLPWMAAETRNPWPKRIVWVQGNTVHDRFYWLKLPAGSGKKGDTIRAAADGQKIALESTDVHHVTIRLSDALLDMDQPVTVTANGKQVFSAIVPRTAACIWQTLQERADPASAATGEIEVNW